MNEDSSTTQLLDAVTNFANQLFLIPIPPHGRMAVVSNTLLHILMVSSYSLIYVHL